MLIDFAFGFETKDFTVLEIDHDHRARSFATPLTALDLAVD
jgi:hypothetical protein